MTYAKALEELEDIMDALRSGKVDIDQLESKTQRATTLINWCNARLRTVEGQLDAIVDNTDSELF